MLFRKLTAALPFLKKEKLSEKELEEAVKNLNREGIIDALKSSGQDPQELADMVLVAFDESVKIARERYESLTKQVVEYLNKV